MRLLLFTFIFAFSSAQALDCRLKKSEGKVEAGKQFAVKVHDKKIELTSDYLGKCEGGLKDYSFWYTVTKSHLSGTQCKVGTFTTTFLYEFPAKGGTLMVSSDRYQVDEYHCL